MPKLADVLFDDLRSSKNNINRILSAGLLFAFIAHFYVVEPYFDYKKEEKTITKKLNKDEGDYEVLSKQSQNIINLNQQIFVLLEKFKQETDNLPFTLNEITKNIKRAPSSTSSKFRYGAAELMLAEDDELYLLGITTFKEAVDFRIKEWFLDLNKKLKDELVTPVEDLKITINGVEDIDLKMVIDRAVTDIEVCLNGLGSDFWTGLKDLRSETKAELKLQNVVENSIKLVDRTVLKLVEQTNDGMKTVDLNKSKKMEELQKLIIRKDKLATRYNSLQSPLGRIPADLNDIIKLFPLILVGLLITITLTLRKINSLRISFCRELKKDRRKSSDDASLHRLVHCWFLPPYKSILPLVVLGICVAVIIGIFYRSVSLVVGESELFVKSGSDEVNTCQ
jgi:hypothetical protein